MLIGGKWGVGEGKKKEERRKMGRSEGGQAVSVCDMSGENVCRKWSKEYE